MPTACSPQDCTSTCRRLGQSSLCHLCLSDSGFCLPLSFFLLIRSLLFPPKILSHLSLFPAPLSVLRHAFLHFSSPLHRPFVLLHPCLSHSPYVLSFFHIIMYAHVCGCGSAASFASLQVSSPLYIIKGTENK